MMQKHPFIATIMAAALFLPVTAKGDSLITGQVVKVDGPTGTITVRHGPIAHLGLIAANKVDAFRVTGNVMEGMAFNALRTGDQIKFQAERINGELTITSASKN
jgi:Cu(I)/Ag(I) efflux system periplasmic protein CusF